MNMLLPNIMVDMMNTPMLEVMFQDTWKAMVTVTQDMAMLNLMDMMTLTKITTHIQLTNTNMESRMLTLVTTNLNGNTEMETKLLENTPWMKLMAQNVLSHTQLMTNMDSMLLSRRLDMLTTNKAIARNMVIIK
jgi:hypothetical protein